MGNQIFEKPPLYIDQGMLYCVPISEGSLLESLLYNYES